MPRRGLGGAGWAAALACLVFALLVTHSVAAEDTCETCAASAEPPGDAWYMVRDRRGPSLFGVHQRQRLVKATPGDVRGAAIVDKPVPKACDPTVSLEMCACRPAMLVQSDHRAPSAAALAVRLWEQGGLERLRNASLAGALSLLDKTYIANSAFAWLHGHGYVFAVVRNDVADGGSGRHPAWAKVHLLKHMALVCPAAKTIVYLDSDAYIRAPSEALRTVRHPHFNRTLALAPECNWFHSSTGGAGACRNMAEHQDVMDGAEKFEDTSVTGLFNTGVIAVLNVPASVPILEAWWNFPAPKQVYSSWPWEQRVFTSLLASQPTVLGRQVLLLDPSSYNGNDGTLVRHMYGSAFKRLSDTIWAAHAPTDLDVVLRVFAERVALKGPAAHTGENVTASEPAWHVLLRPFVF